MNVKKLFFRPRSDTRLLNDESAENKGTCDDVLSDHSADSESSGFSSLSRKENEKNKVGK